MTAAGAFGYAWSTLALGGFFILSGILNLLPTRLEPVPEPAWLLEARARHPEAGPVFPPSLPGRGWRIAIAFMMFFLAAIQLFGRRPPDLGRTFLILIGSLFLVFAVTTLVGLLRPARTGPGWRERRRRRKLEQRLARGSDAYAEELRALLQPIEPHFTVRPAAQRANLIIFTLAGAALLAAGLATPR